MTDQLSKDSWQEMPRPEATHWQAAGLQPRRRAASPSQPPRFSVEDQPLAWPDAPLGVPTINEDHQSAASGPPTSTQLEGLQRLLLIADGGEPQEQAKGRPPKLWDPLRLGGRPLLLILALQTLLSARLFWGNTAFQDEALYLWAGRQEIADWTHNAHVSAYWANHLSGAPAVYPPLAAIANSIGGLTAARLLSLIFMLGATALLYSTALRLFDRRVAIMAAAFFATLGWADQLGAFATFDAPAIFLLALSTWLVVRAQGRACELLLVAAAIVLALADAAKYATLLWDPIVVGVVVLTATQGGWLRKAVRGLRFTGYVAAIIGIALRIGGHDYITGLNYTTLHRQLDSGTAPLKVVAVAWGWLALLFLLAFLGIFLSWFDNGKPNLMPVLLVAAGLLAPLAQAHNSDIISLHKHVVFGAWFMCMMTGYAASKLTHLDNKLSHGALIAIVTISAGALSGYFEVNAYIKTWPGVGATMPALETSIAAKHCPCLIFQNDAAHYYLPANLLTKGVVGPYHFLYHDPHSWRSLHGREALVAAIGNGYFGAAEIDASQGDSEYRFLVDALRSSKQYKLVSSETWPQHPNDPTEVWVLSIGGGQS